MEIFNTVQEITEMLMNQPWYMNLAIVVEATVMFLIILAVLICLITITKILFTADFVVIGICIYKCYEERCINVYAVITIVVLTILLTILFFIIYIMNESYTGILATFFGSLLEGAVNMMILFACGTVILIPLAAMCWGQNDRYS